MQCRGHMFSLTSYSSILCKWLYIFYGPSSQLLPLHTPPALHWEMKSSASGQAQTTCLNYYMIYFLPLSPFVPRNKLLHRTQLVLTSEHNDNPPQNNMSLGCYILYNYYTISYCYEDSFLIFLDIFGICVIQKGNKLRGLQ